MWRGGASIFAKAVLDAHGAERDVHLVDSFQGLPPNTTAEDHQVSAQWLRTRLPGGPLHMRLASRMPCFCWSTVQCYSCSPV